MRKAYEFPTTPEPTAAYHATIGRPAPTPALPRREVEEAARVTALRDAAAALRDAARQCSAFRQGTGRPRGGG